MESKTDNQNSDPRRKILNVAVASIALETGFDTVEKQALETLTEMLQCFLTEVGQTSRNYCELAGRTDPVNADVIMAMIDMGISWTGIESYARRDNRHVVGAPQQITPQKQLNILQAGTKSSHPSHIPGHLPALPDPHAYIRTPTHKQPVTEYEAIREKSANQKRDVERALTRFLAKTSDTHLLFDSDDNTMFPLIACKPTFPPYLAALMPTDQVFDFEELEYHYQVANRTEDLIDKKDSDNDRDEDNDGPEPVDGKLPDSTEAANNIDNPYLQAPKVPKKSEPI